MKRKLIVLLVAIILASCGKTDIDPDDNSQVILPGLSGEYPVSINFEPSVVRNYHGTYIGSYDLVEIGQQLIEKSKKHFDVEKFILQEGQIINNQRLSSLVRRESTENPAGLNPANGTQFDIGNDVVLENPVLVADVIEINFLDGAGDGTQLAGIGLAVVFNQVQRVETATSVTTYEVSDDRMYEYATDVGRKLESYVRTLNQVGDIPIFITLFTTRRVDEAVPGSFMGEGYFVARSGQFTRLDEKWVIYPSNEAEALNPVMSTFFNGLKQSLQTILPEANGVIGKGRFQNGQLDYLKIDVQMVAKTFMEIKATTQLAGAIIEGIDDASVHVLVEITSHGNIVAIVEKLRNQNKVSITYISA